MSWSNDLDMLAQAGVLDFDAPSYIYGRTPRYIGNPVMPNPFGEGIENPKLPEQPKIDEFKQPKVKEFQQPTENEAHTSNSPVWKKVLFGTVAIGALIFGGYKCKNLINKGWNSLTNLFKGKSTSSSTSSFSSKLKSAWSSTTSACKKGWHATTGFFSKGWKKFTGLFHK